MTDAIDLASKLCRAFEGYRSKPYACPAGVATIGLLNKIGVNNVRPFFPVSDSIYQASRNVCDNGQCVRRDTFCEQPSNIDNLFASQFMPRRVLSAQINETAFPLVLRIFRKADPFKILMRVIQFVAINMIDGKARFMPSDKCEPDKSMDKMVNSDAIFHRINFKVPVFCFNFSEIASLKGRCKCLLFPITDSCVGSGMRGSFDSTVGANKPANTLRLNFFPNLHDCTRVSCEVGILP